MPDTAPDVTVPIVRAVQPADVDGIAALYEALSPHDRQRRFFSPFLPPRDTLASWASLHPPAGVGLVAEVTLPNGVRELVGHADCHRLANGNGELAVTVAEPWRGGLGGRLLDALRREAAAIGVPNLEAELYVTNRPMHTLLAGRGAAITARPDFVFERVVISTSGEVPTWSSADSHPRLLIEHSGWPALAEVLGAEGWTVMVCPGPEQRRECPALVGHACPLAAGADAVAVLLTTPTGAELASAHRCLHAAPTFVGVARDTTAIADALRSQSGSVQRKEVVRP